MWHAGRSKISSQKREEKFNFIAKTRWKILGLRWILYFNFNTAYLSKIMGVELTMDRLSVSYLSVQYQLSQQPSISIHAQKMNQPINITNLISIITQHLQGVRPREFNHSSSGGIDRVDYCGLSRSCSLWNRLKRPICLYVMTVFPS